MNLDAARPRVRVLQAVELGRGPELLQWTRSIRYVRIRSRNICACRTLGNVRRSTLSPDRFAVVDRLDVTVAPYERVLGRFEEALEDLAPIPFFPNLLGQRVAAGLELKAGFPDLSSLELDCVGDFWNEKISVQILLVPSPVICPPKGGRVLSKDGRCSCKGQIRFPNLGLELFSYVPRVAFEILRSNNVALPDASLLNPADRNTLDYTVDVRLSRL